MTLVEIMVAVGLFALVAGGVISCLIQTLKFSESNLAQSYAQSIAQSIMEQVISNPPSLLCSGTETQVEITLPALNSSNYTTMPGLMLPWSTTATSFTDVGPTTQGVLSDAAYIASAHIIRPERYLRMRVNLQRTVETNDNRVRIVLRYQWAIPDRTGAAGAPIYLSGEIRTVRSMALRF